MKQIKLILECSETQLLKSKSLQITTSVSIRITLKKNKLKMESMFQDFE